MKSCGAVRPDVWSLHTSWLTAIEKIGLMQVRILPKLLIQWLRCCTTTSPTCAQSHPLNASEDQAMRCVEFRLCCLRHRIHIAQKPEDRRQAMRHPASRSRMGQNKGGKTPDYFKMKGEMKKQRKVKKKTDRKDNHEHRTGSAPLRKNRGQSSD